jgi:hypothetical protein
MHQYIRSGLMIFLSTYATLAISAENLIFVEPLPIIPERIEAGRTLTIQFIIKNQTQKPKHSIPIYPVMLNEQNEPDSSIAQRIDIGAEGDCGEAGNPLSAGAQCMLTYKITAPNTPGVNYKQTLSINDHRLTHPIDFRATGTTWEKAGRDDPDMPFVVWALAFDAKTETLYAGTFDYYHKGEVYSLDLTNPFDTWRRTARLKIPVVSLLFDEETRTLYAGAGVSPAYVYRYDVDEGTQWEKIGGPISPAVMIPSLVLDKKTSTLYLSDTYGTVQSGGVKHLDLTQDRAIWTRTGKNVPSNGSTYFLVLDNATRTLYASAYDDLCHIESENGVYGLKIDDEDSSWVQIGNGKPGGGNVGPLVLDTESNKLYAGLLGDYSGVFGLDLNVDTNTWYSIGMEPTPLPGSGLVQSLLVDKNTVYAGTGWGFCKKGNTGVWSTDLRGHPWHVIGSSGFPTNVPTPSLVLDPKTNILYVGTFSGVMKIQQ